MNKTKVGLLVAIEMDSIFDYYTDIEKLDCPEGFQLYHCSKSNSDIYIIRTGMGEIAAASGTQYLITKYGVDIIVNFGVVGGLTPEMKRCKLCVVERVVHYRYDCSEFLDLEVGQVEGLDSIFMPTDNFLLQKALDKRPDLFKATCCSADKFVSKEEDKREMHLLFEGDICDMEASGVLLTCKANGVPCLMLKAVSDGLDGGADEFFVELYNASIECLKVTDSIIETL